MVKGERYPGITYYTIMIDRSKRHHREKECELIKRSPAIARVPLILFYYWHDIPTMWPYIKVFGWQYVYDRHYRSRMRNRVHKKRYTASFNTNKHKIRANLVKRDGYGCRHCHIHRAGETLTIDHVVPISVGGSNALTNLQLLCRPCHEKKSLQEQDTIAYQPPSKNALTLKVLTQIKKDNQNAREKSKRKVVGALQTPNPFTLREHMLHMRRTGAIGSELAYWTLYCQQRGRRLFALRPKKLAPPVSKMQRIPPRQRGNILQEHGGAGGAGVR